MNLKLAILLFTAFFINAAQSHATNYITNGYMDKISYNHGDTANVFISANGVLTNVKLYLYNVNYTIVDSVSVNLSPQSISPTNTAPWENGYGYSISFSYTIPANLKSGMYNWENKIFFIVKSATKNADITLIYPSNTENAYNAAGGKSLYPFNSTGNIKATAVSFLRPLTPSTLSAVKIYCDGLMQWINTLNYSVQIICDQDMDDYSEIQNTKIIAVIGHSEYWTRVARLNFDQFVNSGKDAMVLSGNSMWWQVRYSPDKTKLICYKSASADTVLNPLLKTINWSDSSLQYPILNSIGVDYVHGAYPPNPYHSGWYGYKIMLPNSPLLAGTGLSFNSILSCKSREYDGTLFSGFDILGNPVLDTTTLGFCKIELIGYDWAINTAYIPNLKGYGTFVAFKKNPSSGNVINTAFTNWCALYQASGWTGGFGGPDAMKIKQITSNMFNLLLAQSNIYATPASGCVLSAEDAVVASNEEQFVIFPNPTRGNFEVRSEKSELKSVKIYNIKGEKVYSTSFPIKKERLTINLSSHPNGIYLISLITQKGTTVKKVVISR